MTLPEAGGCEQEVTPRVTGAAQPLLGPSAALVPVCAQPPSALQLLPLPAPQQGAGRELIQMWRPLALLAVPSQPC